MTAHSLKTKKVKHKRYFVGCRDENTTTFGLSKAESRGIFGTCYEYTDKEKERIKQYQNKTFKNRGISTNQPYQEFKQRSKQEQMAQQSKAPRTFEEAFDEKRDELAKLGVRLVGFKKSNGVVYHDERQEN